MDKAERRTNIRRSIRVPIMCWELEGDKPIGAGLEIISKDLSVTGIAFESDKIHPLGKALLSEVYLPGRKNPVVTRLKVARIESVLGNDKYLIGASFDGIAQEDRMFVASCLEKMNLYTILDKALAMKASDLHLTVGRAPLVREHGRIHYLKMDSIQEGEIKAMVYPLLNNRQIQYLEKNKELDFAFSPNVQSRFRVNLHFQKGFLEAALRSIPTHTQSFEELNLPVATMEKFCKEKSGLILITGTTGAGKTTTVASMIDYINRHFERVVITIEDPIEYLHTSQKSVLKQRELGSDTDSYAEALKRTLRQDPDVIVVGELLDSACVTAAIRAAETGHLVISTVHAPDTTQAVERVVNFFPPEHAPSICQQISTCMIGILFQLLLPGKDGKQVLATELMTNSTAVKNMIREGKYNQMRLSIQTGREYGMYTLETKLKELYEKALIDYDVMQEYGKPR